MQITTDAVIIKTKPFKGDRIIHLLTPDMGVISAYARGAINPRGKLSGATELICYSRFVLEKKRDSLIVVSADYHRLFFGIRQDIEKLSLATYLCELAGIFCREGEQTEQQQKLLLNSLHILEENMRPISFIKAVFELRLLTLSGFMPDLVGCANCGKHENEYFSLFLEDGIMLCSDCVKSGSRRADIKLSYSVVNAMRHIIYSTQPSLFSFTLGGHSLDLLAKATEQYLLSQIEFTPNSLGFLKDILT